MMKLQAHEIPTDPVSPFSYFLIFGKTCVCIAYLPALHRPFLDEYMYMLRKVFVKPIHTIEKGVLYLPKDNDSPVTKKMKGDELATSSRPSPPRRASASADIPQANQSTRAAQPQTHVRSPAASCFVGST